jgi:hypothetical protein
MTYKKLNLLFIALVVMVISASVLGITQSTHNAELDNIDCLECHTCKVPTVQDMCLRACPSISQPKMTAAHKLVEAPDEFLIDEITNLYQPVKFNHKLHADMAQMGGDCGTCHHYSPPGVIPPCSECHGGEKNPNNLRQPSLKGAYHRQCLSCHREWSHDTKCIICHLPTEGKPLAIGFDSADIIGISHPVITVPDKRVYHTPYEPGPVVTLQHKEHIDLFGLRCVDCHKQENCSYCHDMDIEAKISKSDEEIHSICNDCHLKDRCDKCHDTVERPSFSHASTGWALNRFHKGAQCRACHPTGKKISKLNNKCTACHSGWKQGSFDHAVVGLRLDDIHIELDCEDCHTDLAYNKAPACESCHDEGTNPKETPPGEFLKR